MVFGIALVLSGAAVLFGLRRALWPRIPDEPPVELDHDYDAQPIYVPADRGTIYVSEIRD
ncbi:hypothetical protein [Phytohabitans rumicis]|uniref:Uncharacterized protein n=1 Tax=Phytohabitans rumicis TaxID=1076125 RepID=A0A6V8LB75_9ACTN|nr:hypothetical protein [Phytohabitans rumicis]GFJ91317.1 hypothetical protein Prum_049590 [Phytohabitans rumicis]